MGVPVCYNGNISASSWQNGSGEKQAYGYTYNGLNRLISAFYGSGTGTIARTDKYSVTGISYDRNGNLLNLTRFRSGIKVDQLTYRYAGNRLENVKDNSGYSFGYPTSGTLSDKRYYYDANGNMTEDLSKNITGITYNYLLMNKVSFSV